MVEKRNVLINPAQQCIEYVVNEKNVEFYAGVPRTTPDNLAIIGSNCNLRLVICPYIQNIEYIQWEVEKLKVIG